FRARVSGFALDSVQDPERSCLDIDGERAICALLAVELDNEESIGGVVLENAADAPGGLALASPISLLAASDESEHTLDEVRVDDHVMLDPLQKLTNLALHGRCVARGVLELDDNTLRLSLTRACNASDAKRCDEYPKSANANPSHDEALSYTCVIRTTSSQ
ncbi:MAG: hypothetical protein AAGC55_20785, partial [Myxococcota bacterium]